MRTPYRTVAAVAALVRSTQYVRTLYVKYEVPRNCASKMTGPKEALRVPVQCRPRRPSRCSLVRVRVHVPYLTKYLAYVSSGVMPPPLYTRTYRASACTAIATATTTVPSFVGARIEGQDTHDTVTAGTGYGNDCLPDRELTSTMMLEDRYTSMPISNYYRKGRLLTKTTAD